ncbi:MAG: tRNA 2-thiouridine(34) synthase MnmA [bacterium]
MSSGRGRVAVAMSGGVDSAVAAYLLAQQGYDVLGVTLKLFCYGEADAQATDKSCCSLDAIDDARRSARAIGARHVVLDFADEFRTAVLDPFVGDYLDGRTPSPCVACNSEVKFNRFLVRALRQGADFIATGHYAKVVDGDGGRRELHAGDDAAKDQSYFLWGIEREALARVLLPVGGLTKPEVRQIARRAGLSVAEKRESMDICFVPRGDYGEFLEKQGDGDERMAAALAPGPIVDRQGVRVGTHDGYARFTVGQRKGLGLSAGRPLYVTAVEPGTRSIVVGGGDDLLADGCDATGANFLAELPANGRARVTARIRHRHAPVPGTLTHSGDGRVRVLFDEPQRAVTPGQSVVFYDGSRVLGGAVISGAIPRGA